MMAWPSDSLAADFQDHPGAVVHRPRDDGLAQGGLCRVELVVVAQHGQNVGAQLVERLETKNGIHGCKHCLR